MRHDRFGDETLFPSLIAGCASSVSIIRGRRNAVALVSMTHKEERRNIATAMLGKGALVFLHGSGGNGREMRSFLESIPLDHFGHETFGAILRQWNIELYTPTAKERRYSACYNDLMTVWHDRSPNFPEEGMSTSEDLEGIDQSINFIRKFIQDIEETQPFDYLILGGFSMGGGLSLHSYRREIHPKLQAVFSLSSWASDPSAIYKDPLSSHRNVPLLMLHGEDDDLILYDWGKKTSAGLLMRDINVIFYSYAHLGHEIIPQELSDLLDWIKDLRKSSLSNERRSEARVQRLEAKYAALEKSAIDNTADAPVGQRACLTQSLSDTSHIAESKVSRSSTSAKAEDEFENQGYTCITECLPFKIEPLSSVSIDTSVSTPRGSQLKEMIVKYRLDSEYVPILLSRPVLACGSMFDIVDDRPHGVIVHVTSPAIDKTAYEIGRRLFIRLRSESQSLNPCAPS